MGQIKQASAWLRHNWLLAVLATLTLGQLPVSIPRLIGGDESSSRSRATLGGACGHRRSSATSKPLPSALPSRQDPFMPLEGQPYDGKQPTMGESGIQPQPGNNSLPNMARVLSGINVEKGLPKLEAAPVVAVVSATPKQNPKLQGVIRSGDRRIAVFQVQANDVAYLSRDEPVPTSTLVVKDILDDCVVLADKSGKHGANIKVVVGKHVYNP